MSKPMDFNEMQSAKGVMQTNEPVLNNTYTSNDYNRALIDQINQDQLKASLSNADLRKKLRVDRIRKMTVGSAIADGAKRPGTTASLADPHKPDWAKYKSLQEIDVIRKSKKEAIIN